MERKEFAGHETVHATRSSAIIRLFSRPAWESKEYAIKDFSCTPEDSLAIGFDGIMDYSADLL